MSALMRTMLILCLAGCVDERTIDTAMDAAMTRAAEIGGCVKAVCHWPPVKCGPRVGSCR